MDRRPDADVVVVGLGAMGAAAAWQLAKRGARVVAIEQFEPGHERGSSHGESRIIRTAYFEGPFYVPLVRRAWDLWRQLEVETGEELLIETGCLLMGRRDGALISGAEASARGHGVPYEVLSGGRFAERFPQQRLREDEVALFETGGGVLRPERAVRAAARLAVDSGVKLVTGTRVERIAQHDDVVEIVTGDQTFVAAQVLVTVGAWLPKLAAELDGSVAVERIVQHWFRARDSELFEPARFPPFIREESAGEWFGMPALDHSLVKVARHHGGAPADPDTVDRAVSADDVEPVAALVSELLPGLDPVPVNSSVCMYVNTPDLDFLVGRLSASPQVLVMGGFSGHGFKFATVMGEIAADLLLDGSTRHDVRPFALDRFSRERSSIAQSD